MSPVDGRQLLRDHARLGDRDAGETLLGERGVEPADVARLELGGDRRVVPLRLADLLAQLELQRAEAADLAVRELERLDQDVLLDDLRARLDHRDRVGGAAHDQVERRLGHVGHRRVDDELVAEPADAHGADRAQEGQRRDDERGRGPVDREDVMRVHAVDRQHGRDDLDLVLESLGPERPDRPIDHARVQGRLLGGLALALEEPAGDLPGGVHLLFDVDGQREEVGAFPRLGAADRGRQHHRLAGSHDHGSIGLLGQSTGAEGDLLASDLDRDGNLAGLRQRAHIFALCFLFIAAVPAPCARIQMPAALHERPPSGTRPRALCR